MIGALVLKVLWKRRVEAAFADRDLDRVMSGWAPDGVLEFGGTGAMSGRYAGHAEIRTWMQTWFERMAELHVRVGRVALARPWALGLDNTVMYEFHVEETSHDGVSVVADVLVVAELRRGRIVHSRDYLFDETPERVMWGPGDHPAQR